MSQRIRTPVRQSETLLKAAADRLATRLGQMLHREGKGMTPVPWRESNEFLRRKEQQRARCMKTLMHRRFRDVDRLLRDSATLFGSRLGRWRCFGRYYQRAWWLVVVPIYLKRGNGDAQQDRAQEQADEPKVGQAPNGGKEEKENW
jgi:hypothetical protein